MEGSSTPGTRLPAEGRVAEAGPHRPLQSIRPRPLERNIPTLVSIDDRYDFGQHCPC